MSGTGPIAVKVGTKVPKSSERSPLGRTTDRMG